MWCLVSLTEELLSSSADYSAKRVRDLLFARLAPLLALKVVPFRAFGLADGPATSDQAEEEEQPLRTDDATVPTPHTLALTQFVHESRLLTFC